MDLYAYSQIERLQSIADENNIKVPRLRGYRLMSEETPIDEDIIQGSVDMYGERARLQIETFNKYVGKSDILYIHARIGGGNWPEYRKDVESQPWFIEKVDDEYDPTYCDIYAKIKED